MLWHTVSSKLSLPPVSKRQADAAHGCRTDLKRAQGAVAAGKRPVKGSVVSRQLKTKE
jgi:hypothetical protein